ncbi:rhomboid family intramembrane serine protease [Epibacterium sp. SM1979]|uniref:Rhomboid family intramembrane serine protease n=1 Tax=Tritonibacter litoralis TaxID=2662264 RepID=A0A843YMR8_9RHOB|nr:rhomboid family intramembrane serine protease [Tritonibacter litoralis]MQQ09937.1 rhomboid family intramembrane serine protease [Tritonibacter litoralis]
MFPLRDQNPSGRTPYVTYALMAVNILAYLWYASQFPEGRALAQFYDVVAVVPIEITHGQDWGTLLTSMFVHAGLLHLAGNMLFLWIFGDNIEDEMGHLPFFLFYLASGVAAALAQVGADPTSQIPTVGASGAIAGVMGAYLLMYPRAKVDVLLVLIIFFRVFSIPAVWVLGTWFAMQFLGGFTAPTDQGGVAYWAHAGGFVAGLALCLPLWLLRGGPRFWRRTHGHPPHPTAQYAYSASHIPKIRRAQPRKPGPWGK